LSDQDFWNTKILLHFIGRVGFCARSGTARRMTWAQIQDGLRLKLNLLSIESSRVKRLKNELPRVRKLPFVRGLEVAGCWWMEPVPSTDAAKRSMAVRGEVSLSADI
jgi:hypothetical protein